MQFRNTDKQCFQCFVQFWIPWSTLYCISKVQVDNKVYALLNIYVQNKDIDFIQFYRKIHCLTSTFHVKCHAKNLYRTNHKAMSAITFFQLKFNMEFTVRQ